MFIGIGRVAQTRDGAKIVAKRKELPTEDATFGRSRVREDGGHLHAIYRWEVKKPAESNAPWDYAGPDRGPRSGAVGSPCTHRLQLQPSRALVDVERRRCGAMEPIAHRAGAGGGRSSLPQGGQLDSLSAVAMRNFLNSPTGRSSASGARFAPRMNRMNRS